MCTKMRLRVIVEYGQLYYSQPIRMAKRKRKDYTGSACVGSGNTTLSRTRVFELPVWATLVAHTYRYKNGDAEAFHAQGLCACLDYDVMLNDVFFVWVQELQASLSILVGHFCR